jgi:DNA adenine methylase
LYAKAGDFIYLNRTCWNGLYRVNQKGEFNVPIGDRNSVIRVGDNFSSISEALSDTELKICCFTDALSRVRKNDFCFIDPPYTVKHDYNGFIRYNENIFSWENQKVLRDVVADIHDSGGMALVLNANHDSIKKLYKGLGKIVPLHRSSMLAANSAYRGNIKEIAIMVGYEK